jgi:AsmA protein
MTKFLKFTGIVVGVIALVLVIAMVLLVTFVSPNRFKPVLTEQVKKFTGRELTLDGDLSWSFFPYFGVTAGHMSLGNPADFKEKIFAEFSSATVGVKVLPLFHGRIQSSGVVLHGMKLNLIKNADGKTNWVFQKSGTDQSSEPSSTKKKMAAGGVGLAVSAVDITDASVTWRDEQAKQNATINHFDLHAKNINLIQAFPVEMSCDFDSHNPLVSGHAELTSDVAFNIEKQVYSLRNLDFTIQTHKGDQKINLHVTGDVIADMLQQTLQWTNFKASMADLNLTGKVNVLQLTSAPQASGHFDIKPFDLKKLLQNLGQDTSSLQTAKDVDGSVDFSASSKSVKASGLIKIDEVQAAKVKLDKVNAHLQFQDGTLTLSPVTASFYQGSLNADSTVKLNTPLPQISLRGNLTNVQAGPLFEDLGGANKKLKLSGVANVQLQVTTLGKDANTITKNLNGNSKLALSNGVLEGIDLGYLVDSADALINKQSAPQTNSKQTTFGNLTATAVIQNGVVSNNDLLIDSPRFNTTGKGTINLVSQTIDYSLQTAVKQTQIDTVKHYAGAMIPITVTGSLNDPSVRLDTQQLLKSVAQQQFDKHKEQIQQKIQENIEKQIPGEAGKVLQNLLGH